MGGHSEDLIPWLLSQMPVKGGPASIDLVFLDQRGSRYASDLSLLEAAGSLTSGCKGVADNVMKPGSPQFLWKVSHSETYSTQVVSVEEFAMPGVEDWMTVSTYKPGQTGAPSAPAQVLKLEWLAEQMRAKAHRP